MNGRQHYQEAERLLSRINAPDVDWTAPGQLSRAEVLALAQVHATLAATAAQASGNAHWDFDPAQERERERERPRLTSRIRG
jgi:hypothetical protein